MGSASVLEPTLSADEVDLNGKKVDSASTAAMVKKERKRNASRTTEESTGTRKMPRRAAACLDFKEKSVRMSDKDCVVEKKEDQVVEEEAVAVRLTAGSEDGKPCRKLTEFVLHNSSGIPQSFEMSEVEDIFISGLILPLEAVTDKKKLKGIKCEGFGRIESWAISGYEDGVPAIWLSTDIADYDCIKPSGSYKKFYDHFLAKATACIEVYKKLSKSSGGNPDTSLDELVGGVVRVMSGMKCFSRGASIRDFIISQGQFIYNQLVGLDETSKTGQLFLELPVLIALRDEMNKQGGLIKPQPRSSDGSIKIGPKVGEDKESDLPPSVEEDEDMKLARLLQEEEHWNSRKQKKGHASTSSLSKFYIKINEDEIANDYPLPAYYKTSNEETDEYVVFDSSIDECHIDDLPRGMLHNWALYNSDSRLISLELLPMKPCDDIDVTIFGSGVMTSDDGSGYHFDADSNQSSSGSSAAPEVDGMPLYLSAIKEWMIEFGSSMVFVSVRTDMAWYRLGKPSKQYAPWYEPVLKTARLAITIITLLKDQSRVARISFADAIKKVSELDKNHPAFISSNPAVVERYVVVHGQIILQQFLEFPDKNIKKSGFVLGLTNKMEERHHTKWLMKKKKILQRNGMNLNPRAAMGPVVSKRKAMQATTTKLINRIWGEYYSNYSPDVSNEGVACDVKGEEIEETEELEENEEQEDNDEEAREEDVVVPEKVQEAREEVVVVPEKVHTPSSASKQSKSLSTNKEIRWAGESVGRTSDGYALYKQAIVDGFEIEVGAAVLVDVDESKELLDIYFVEYMFEKLDGSKMFHGCLMQRGSETFLGNTLSEREIFLIHECMDFELVDAKETVPLELRRRPWGYQYRKADIEADKNDRARADERKKKGLPVEYYCRSLYSPEEGGFFALPIGEMGLGSGFCSSCKLNETESKMEVFQISKSRNSFVYEGNEYSVHDFVYVSPHHFDTGRKDGGTFKGGRNVGLKAYVICQLLEIIPNASKKTDIDSTQIKVQRFFRPEDISEEKAYCSDIREVYYSEETHTIPLHIIEGKCEVRKKCDLPLQDVPALYEHVFFCEHMYDPCKGSLKQLPLHIKLNYSSGKLDDAASRKRKGKCIEGENGSGSGELVPEVNRLVTLDIFAGCGGLSEGLHQSGVSTTKWAIEYDEAAGEAFKLNHPDSLVFVNNCNVILRAVMQKCGDIDDCISTPEAAELEAKLDKEMVDNLPLPGQVDFINGGPPCQGFSGMNRFNQSTWSKVQCEMILGYLSFADIYRSRFFLLENVRNFVSFNQGQTFKLTVASLLEMGYQVRFGILEAGTYGVPQSRKRAFIWAASPEETLPKWPEPMHVFSAPELKIKLEGNMHYAAARTTANGAPFRALTVRDTIGDLPPVSNGASKAMLEYKGDPVSWFQRSIRGNSMVLSDHVSKEMNELNLIRCQRIPKRAGADWRDLPEEKVTLSTGQVVDLIPWCLPNTAKRHNQWKGLFGRLDWEGNFPTSITDPQPMGKVGMCFHPEEDRIVTVRECARSQGFPDTYQFAGNILSKHRQIGNAVPPPMAYALGRKLKEALESKKALKNY